MRRSALPPTVQCPPPAHCRRLLRAPPPVCNRWPMPSKKPPAPSLTYGQWRERARAKLARPSPMREKAWVHAFIIGKTPDEAAALAETYAYNLADLEVCDADPRQRA